MIRGILIILEVLILIETIKTGEWSQTWLVMVIIGVLLILGSLEREESRAILNFERFWSKGGVERDTEEERRTERRARRKRRKGPDADDVVGQALRRAERAVYGRGNAESADVRSVYVCSVCGEKVDVPGAWTDGKKKVEYWCPTCGAARKLRVRREVGDE